MSPAGRPAGQRDRAPARPAVPGADAAGEEDPVASLGSRLRGLRRERGLTLARLAERTGLSVGHLSQVERTLSTPTIRQLQDISRAMGVHIGWFFRAAEPAPERDGGIVVRSARRPTIDYGTLGVTDYLLVPDLDRSLELLLCVLEPGAGSGPEAYTHEGEEAGLLLSGSLELWVDEGRYRLEEGDSFAFASSRPHRYRNPGPGTARVVWAITPPSF